MLWGRFYHCNPITPAECDPERVRIIRAIGAHRGLVHGYPLLIDLSLGMVYGTFILCDTSLQPWRMVRPRIYCPPDEAGLANKKRIKIVME
jgi:hypothetical protein